MIRPFHDTPIGTIHPYWARKPMNVLEEIISAFSQEGQLIVDPFMGSGTTVFAAAKLNRRAFGSDLSNLSCFLVNALVEVMQGGAPLLDEIQRLLDEIRSESSHLFTLDSGEEIERIRFRVTGEYDNGDFTLEPTEVISKRGHRERSWNERRTYKPSEINIPDALMTTTDDSATGPIKFRAVKLPKNSRIAIPEGASLDHFFLAANQVIINMYLVKVRQSPFWGRFPQGMQLVLSASLPLLRLSDKKATSQWPFWRPKHELTSRNPIMVFQKKMEAIRQLRTWADETFTPAALVDINIRRLAAQDLTQGILDGTAQLVLTDPPYGDQVPYLEYSNLWNAVLGFELEANDYSLELVRSDAKFQESNSHGYRQKLADALASNLRLLSQDSGVLVWFYQDHDLRNWQVIHQKVSDFGFEICDVIALPKQRRSLKTVTTPQRTLDGDLLVVAIPRSRPDLAGSAVKLRERLGQGRIDSEFYAKYAEFLRTVLIDGSIEGFAEKYRTVMEAVKGEG